MNAYRGGPYQQAFSALTNLNNDWYNGKSYQNYAFEYTPGKSGDITWFVGDDPSWHLDGRSIGPNGNVGQRVVPYEPMALIMNFGMSNGFSAINLTGINPLLPATMRFDYVRIYQDPDNENMGCDPDDYPTTSYISEHYDAYTNPNLTLWYVQTVRSIRIKLMELKGSNRLCLAEEQFRGWLLEANLSPSQPPPSISLEYLCPLQGRAPLDAQSSLATRLLLLL